MTSLQRALSVAVAVLIVAATTVAIWLRREAVPQPSGETAVPSSLLPSAPHNDVSPDSREASPLRFTSMTAASGIDFTYYGAPTSAAFMTEQNGGGVALVDFDGDGWLDLFFVNGSTFEEPERSAKTSHQLYRGHGDFQYAPVTFQAGLTAHDFGMGCAAGDFDNDGFSDLFVAAYGRDRLWRNNGDGTFVEVTDAAGVGSELWGASAAWADFDGDSLLDLYVVNYVNWSPDEPRCHAPGHPEIPGVCSPMERDGQPDALYRNLGDGRFEELGNAAGVARTDGKGLALAVADFDGDGRLDIYIANDTSPNFLYQNRGEMRFEDVAVLQGVAVSSDGTVGSGMGVGCADFDRNGRLDICVTNFRNQVNDLFANLDGSGFAAANTRTGLDLVSRPMLGFGVAFADFDLDAWPDLFVANGHIWNMTSLGPQYEYQMPTQVLRNLRGQRFDDVSSLAGDYFAHRWLGRAVAIGDLDNDGDADVVVSHLGTPPELLRNDSARAANAVRLTLIGTRSARQPLGATVTLVDADSSTVTQVPSGGSFQASHDPRVLLPIADGSALREIRVAWPGGRSEVWTEVVPDASGDLRLWEGSGTPAAAAPADELPADR